MKEDCPPLSLSLSLRSLLSIPCSLSLSLSLFVCVLHLSQHSRLPISRSYPSLSLCLSLSLSPLSLSIVTPYVPRRRAAEEILEKVLRTGWRMNSEPEAPLALSRSWRRDRKRGGAEGGGDTDNENREIVRKRGGGRGG